MYRTYGRVVNGLLFCVALLNLAWGQGTRATITGIVRDPVGAAIPGADISLRSLSTSAVMKATTGPDGLYAFPDVEAGGYDLTVAVKGFHEYLQRGISVNLGQEVHIDVS